MNNKNDDLLHKLEEDLGYSFKDINLLKTALTHSSYANESKEEVKCYERLEFFGDSILSFIVSKHIYLNCPTFPEGQLTKLRASLVCAKTLSKFSKEINIGKYIYLSKGEMNCGGNERPSILADIFEAILAAIYLDGGMKVAEKFVLRFVKPEIKHPQKIEFKDYKTTLQEIVQKNPEEVLSYVLVEESGPDHDKHFVFEVHLNNNVIGKGGGRSKKDAEQNAAHEALKLLGY